MKRSILLFMFVFITSTLGQPQISFQADSLYGTLGDIITFSWQVKHGEEYSLQLGALDLEGTGIELLDQTTAESDSGTVIEFQTAIYDSVGVYQFPDLDLVMSNMTGQDTLRIPGPPLQIVSILTESDTTFRDIKDLHRIRVPIGPVIFLWLALFLALAYLAYWLINRFKAPADIESGTTITPPEEAHLVAFEALATLEKGHLLKGRKYKAFYSELTYILKQYYEDRFLIDALECTTSELLNKMQAVSEFDSATISKTSGLLNTADLIKFAKASSTTRESKKCFDTVYQIVDATKIIIQNDDAE
ncbi:MAG: hypothetical protein K9M49_05305 [Candidatus Marinimicrobia bacterium]|nr:hypothetical protein [Candidatus Neomarinimicrobiota bacterium]MCF7904554.1 hypothetical protein [Candidatus Neomarinimicrobiota bacterium]